MTNLPAGAQRDLPENTEEGGADVRPMIMLHNALRRESRLLPPLMRGVPDADTGRAQIVARHIDFLTTILQAHHQGEDVVLWPILLDRGPEEITPIVHVMEGHHDQIDQLTKQIAATLAGWRARTEETSVNEVIRQALLHYFELKGADADFVARARAMLARDAEIVGTL